MTTIRKPQLLVLLQFVLFGVLLGAFLIFPAGQTDLARLAGIAVMFIGMGVAGLAILDHLRINRALPRVSPEPNGAVPLVQRGFYSRIRHPIYSGVLLTGCGAAVAHGHIVSLAVAIVLIVFFTYKSRYEESLLRGVYPDYAAYMTRTGRFLPWPGH